MKRHILNIGLVLGVLAAVPAFAYGHGGGGFHGGGGAVHAGGGFRGGGARVAAPRYGGGYRGGGYVAHGYGGGYRPYYRAGYGYRHWVPGSRLTTPYCVAYPYDPACMTAGYWAY